MKSVRSEVASALVVLAVPIGVAAVFPYGALGFRAAPSGDGTRRAFSAAVVTLSADDERAALRSARMSWQREDGGVRQLRTRLLPSELSAAPRTSVLDVRDRTRTSALPVAERGQVPFVPSRAAAAPVRIAPAAATGDEAAFSRNELLKID